MNAIMLAARPSSRLREELAAMASRLSESRPVLAVEDTGGHETLCAEPDLSGPARDIIAGLADYGVDTARLESRLDEAGDIGPVCIDIPRPSYSLRYDGPDSDIDEQDMDSYAAGIDQLVRRPISGSETAAAVFGINKEAGQPVGVPVFQEVKQFLKEGEAYDHVWTLQARLQYLTERSDFHFNIGWMEMQGWAGDGRQKAAGLGIGGSYRWLDDRRLKTYADFKVAAFENYHGLYNRWKDDKDDRNILYGFAAAYMGAEYTMRRRWPVGLSVGASCEAMMACAGHAEASLGYNARDFNVRAYYGISKPVSDSALETLDRGRFRSDFWQKTEFMGLDVAFNF